MHQAGIFGVNKRTSNYSTLGRVGLLNTGQKIKRTTFVNVE